MKETFWDSNAELVEAYETAAAWIEEIETAINEAARREAANEVFLEQLASDVKYFSHQAQNGISERVRKDAKEELELVKKFIESTGNQQKKLDYLIESLFDHRDQLRSLAPLH